MQLENRRDNRVNLSVPVRYKIFQIENLEKDVKDPTLGLKAEIQDLSLGGLQVVSDKPFQSGSVLELEVDIPKVGLIRTVAKVIWCRPREGSSKGEFNSGIQFIPVYEEDLKKLNDYFKTGG